MNIQLNNPRRSAGFALLLVMVLCACSILILVSEMNRTSTVAIQNFRTAKLTALNNAAEAATEKVFAQIAWDFQANGPGYVTNQLAAGAYNMVPTSTDNAYWANVLFSNPQSGAAGSIYVGFLTNYNGPMPTQYTNQYATVSPVYRVAVNATIPGTQFPDVVGTAQEDVMLALVPITTYAIFYNGELEFSDCATMLVNGRVHSNADICVGAGSGATLTFNGPVTSGTSLSAPQRGGVGPWTSPWATTFNAGLPSGVRPLNLAAISKSLWTMSGMSEVACKPAATLTGSTCRLLYSVRLGVEPLSTTRPEAPVAAPIPSEIMRPMHPVHRRPRAITVMSFITVFICYSS